MIPYSYKFSRGVYFADATNLRFYFRGSQDFVLVDYVRTINFRGSHVIRENSEIYTSLENLYEYGSRSRA